MAKPSENLYSGRLAYLTDGTGKRRFRLHFLNGADSYRKGQRQANYQLQKAQTKQHTIRLLGHQGDMICTVQGHMIYH